MQFLHICRLVLISGLMVALAAAPLTAQTGKTTAATSPTEIRTSTTPNVVLGRDLISATKVVEDLQIRLSLLSQAKMAIDRARSEHSRSSRTLQSDAKTLQAMEKEVDALEKRLRAVVGAASRAPVPPAQPEVAPPEVPPPPPAAAISQGPAVNLVTTTPESRLVVSALAQPNVAAPPAPSPPAPKTKAEPKKTVPKKGTKPAVPAPAIGNLEENGNPAANGPQSLKRSDVVQLSLELVFELNSIREETIALTNQVSQSTNHFQEMNTGFESADGQIAAADAQIESVQRAIILGSQQALGPVAMAPFQPYMTTAPQVDTSLLRSLIDRLQATPAPPPPVPSTGDPVDNQLAQLRAAEIGLRTLRQVIASANDARESIEQSLNMLDESTKRVEALFLATKTKLEAELDAANKTKRDLEVTLSDRDQEISQSRINLWLVGAVFLMVIVIATLLIPLSYFPERVSELIIESRVFVEVLSMSFLLLTVIILGTGRLVSGEGLAGLLGTIAGYIFARKTAELNQQQLPTARSLKRTVNELLESESEIQRLEEEVARLEALPESSDRARQLSEVTVKLLAANQRIQQLRAQMTAEAKTTGVGTSTTPGS